MSAQVNYVLLYRARTNWRTTVGTSEELACGGLPGTPVSEPFELAAQEFTVLLRDYWEVQEAIEWREIRPDWWGADLVPGALAAAGEETP